MIKNRIRKGVAWVLTLLLTCMAGVFQLSVWASSVAAGDAEKRLSDRAGGKTTLTYATGYFEWGGHNTLLFEVDETVGFCLNPQMLQPEEGDYSNAYVTEFSAASNMRLAKCLYYGYEGPGDITKQFSDSWEGRAAVTHVAASVAYGDAAPYYGLNQTAIETVQKYLSEIDQKPDLEAERNKVYILRPDAGMQAVGWLISMQPAKGKLELWKESTAPALSDNNDCYHLEGAEYTVYIAGTDRAVGRITTDAKGYGKLEDLEAGTYEVVETKAPEGYLLSTERHTITVGEGATVTYRGKDVPGSSFVDLILLKRDIETGRAQGSATLENAEYTVIYYDVDPM